jgi:hypothetical protein
MIAAPTDMIRALVVQEARIVLPPAGQFVRFDPGAPRVIVSEKDAEVLHASGFEADAESGVMIYGRPVLDGGLDDRFIRHVQILVPSSPTIFFGIDVDPVALGPDRATYKLAPLSAGTRIDIPLMPEQFLVAATEVGAAVLGLIVEYHPWEAA